MARIPDPNTEPAYVLARRLLTDVIPNESSIFEPVSSIWTSANLDKAAKAFIDHPLLDGATYLDKLNRQLNTAEPQIVRLFAELQVPAFLIHWEGAVSREKKRQKIDGVLAIAGVDYAAGITIPEAVSLALGPGFCHPGQFMMVRQDVTLAWHIRFAQAWVSLESIEREQLLNDPWAFKELTEVIENGVKSSRGAAMAWRHLIHPDEFDPIVSRNDQSAIIARWPELAQDGDLDRQILEIRHALEPKWGEGFGWYSPPLRHLLKSPQGWAEFTTWNARIQEAVDLDADERNYKLELGKRFADVIPLVHGADSEWNNAFKSAWNSSLNNLVDWTRKDDFAKWVASDPESARTLLNLLWADEPDVSAVLEAWPEALHGNRGFRLNVISTLLMVANPEQCPPLKVSALEAAFKHAGWAGNEPLNEVEELIQWAYALFDEMVHDSQTWDVPLRDRLDAQGLIWFLVKTKEKPSSWTPDDWNEFRKFRGEVPDDAEVDDPPVENVAIADNRVDYLGQAADELSVSREYLERVEDRLKRKGQIALYGPPGTGKTYFALRFARAIAEGRKDNVTTVQFHPSTSYEDFVEGIRPETVDGQVHYELVQGPFIRLAEKARANRDQTFVIVVDELNRAHLPKVLGELVFLLEYRDDPDNPQAFVPEINLLYRPKEKFTLPKNLYVIGTMNTSDRSVALVDAALRRRFDFFPFFPNKEPVSSMLKNWLVKHPRKLRIAEFLTAVNQELINQVGADFQIGPSHFMGEDDLSVDALGQVWDYGIYPTIEEILWGRDVELASWEWAEVLKRFGSVLGIADETIAELSNKSDEAITGELSEES